ncbi:sigma-E factor negative regulatory protein [Ferrovum sp.]|uniref:sigma-E factor negative regulatory protein n=1 Tax=Ferrovum sp. TaxID=2609467 RepID=UPI002614EBE9|nr:sigma-E factor negative regulatory protein [Ferrovum sp.]
MVMEDMELERLSAAMDGELDDEKLPRLLGGCRHDPVLQESWYLFHLIGETLRDPQLPQACLHGRIAHALKDEPTVLVPGKSSVGSVPLDGATQRRWLAMAAAIAVVVLTTVVLRPGLPTNPVIAQKEPSAPALNENSVSDKDIQTFVALHRQGSPLSEFQTVDYTPQTIAQR